MLRTWDLSDFCVQMIEGFLRELCAVMVRVGATVPGNLNRIYEHSHAHDGPWLQEVPAGPE